jgi:peptidoglycan biosynthesis protein MviN/MurJ (putative lipid II flippase)
MQAKRFSSFQQNTQGLFTVILVSAIVSSVFTCSVVVSTIIGSALGDGSFTLATGVSDETVRRVDETSCS